MNESTYSVVQYKSEIMAQPIFLGYIIFHHDRIGIIGWQLNKTNRPYPDAREIPEELFETLAQNINNKNLLENWIGQIKQFIETNIDSKPHELYKVLNQWNNKLLIDAPTPYNQETVTRKLFGDEYPDDKKDYWRPAVENVKFL